MWAGFYPAIPLPRGGVRLKIFLICLYVCSHIHFPIKALNELTLQSRHPTPRLVFRQF